MGDVLPIIILLAVIAGIGWWWYLRSEKSGKIFRLRTAIEEINAVHGAAKCERIVDLMERVAARHNKKAVVTLWQNIEGPLLQSLPDCPPPTKDRLRTVLEDLHSICRHRDIQRSIMDVRRSLIDS